MNKIVLCGRKHGCCPEVWIDEANVYIEDDNKSVVQITRKQFDILKEKIIAGEI